MPGRWLLSLEAASQPRLNLPVPRTAQPPAITDRSVHRQPDNLSSRRRQIVGVLGRVLPCLSRCGVGVRSAGGSALGASDR
jgi:hypothetical protein